MRTKRPEVSAASNAGTLRILAGLLTAGLVMGAGGSLVLRTTGEWVTPASADAAPTRVEPSASAPKTTPVATPANAPATPVATPAKSPATVAGTPAKAPAAAVTKATWSGKAASSTKPSAVVTPVASAMKSKPATAKSVVVQPSAHLEDRVTYQYNALGRRDPFQAMVDGGFVGNDVGGDAPVDVGAIKVVGIVWGTNDKFALAEDARGNSLVLRQGDKVMNGVVSDLKRDAVLVNLTVDGQSESVVIPLTRKGEN